MELSYTGPAIVLIANEVSRDRVSLRFGWMPQGLSLRCLKGIPETQCSYAPSHPAMMGLTLGLIQPRQVPLDSQLPFLSP